MHQWSKAALTLLLGLGLWLFCFYLYMSHLPFNYTFDGLAFASQVEKNNEPLWVFFHPHHLIYTFLGKLVFLWGRAHGATWDGLVALQFFDILTGTLGVVIFFHLLVRETDDRWVSFLAAAGMAFSHSYWYFSTIPGVRIFATATPLFAWYVLTYQKKKPPLFGWAVGFAHALAVLGHQTNLLLVPAFLGGIMLLREKPFWEKIRASFYYLTGLTLSVSASYAIIGRYIYQRKTFHDWLWWVFSYFHAPQKWGGHFKPSGFERGGSAMGRAFLPDVSSSKTIGESLTYGAADTLFHYAVLFLLAFLFLRFKHHWDNHRQVLWISILWILAFVPFFVWWEPWNIEFWVSSTVPCWILLGLSASDLTQRWKNPVLHFANRGAAIGFGASLIALLFFYNLQGSVAKTVVNHYDFKDLLNAVDWKVRSDDLLVIDGINNVHYYFDRFQKRGYLSLYTHLKKYDGRGKMKTAKKPEPEPDSAQHDQPDPWTDLTDSFQKIWKHHRKVWVLTEAVDNFDGGRRLLEEAMALPDGQVRAYFSQFELQPVSYHGKIYFYEVVQPPPSTPLPAATATPESNPKKKKGKPRG